MLGGFIKQGDAALNTRLYRSLYRIRRVEEEIARIYSTDKIKSPVHLSIGQEGVAVGVCEALEPHDVVFGSYRGHAMYLAKGGDLRRMIAELYGKVDGCARGKGGSMHLIDMNHYILGTSAVVGTTIPIALGYALALQREGTGRVIAAFFGDGATEEGVFHESINFAALHRLPVLFVCENNSLAIHTGIEKRWSSRQLCERIRTYGIPTHEIPDSDVLRIRGLAADSIATMRTGEGGPVFIECQTYRWREHVGPNEDYDAGYRSRDELLKWQANDQVRAIASKLDPAERARIEAHVEKEIAEAIDFAEKSPFPEPEELYKYVFAE
jgi:TPP-dependent pyruvate/acetoin dehydrogenase alpha subunit